MRKEEFVKLSKEKYGDRFNYDFLPELISRTIQRIDCKKHGILRMIPRDHLRSKHGCPHCALEESRASPRKVNAEYIKKANIKFFDKFDYSDVNMEAAIHEKVNITCPKHGIFKSNLHRHYHSLCGCPSCGVEQSQLMRSKYKTLEDILPKVKNIHGNAYSYINYNRTLKILTYKCPQHGRITQLLASHLSGRGCLRCSLKNRTISKEEFIDRAIKIHPSGYRYNLNELKTVNDKITITHECGHRYKARVSNHLAGQGCIACKVSLGEKKIEKFLKLNDIPFVQQYSLAGYQYRYDFLLTELRILIEYDGEQHFKPVDFFGGKKAFKRRKKNDRKKSALAKKNNYILIRVSYKEYENLEEYLSRAIDKYFPYHFNRVFYSDSKTFLNAVVFQEPSANHNVESYRTINVLKPA